MKGVSAHVQASTSQGKFLVTTEQQHLPRSLTLISHKESKWLRLWCIVGWPPAAAAASAPDRVSGSHAAVTGAHRDTPSQVCSTVALLMPLMCLLLLLLLSLPMPKALVNLLW
jgi:hypothetical protein